MAGVRTPQDVRPRWLRQHGTRAWRIQVLRKVYGDVLLLCGVSDGSVAGAQGRVLHGGARVRFARAEKFA